MDFRYTADQQDLIDAAKAVFEGENTLDRLRDLVAKREAGQSITGEQDVWQQFAELGLFGLMADEAHGGLGQSLVLMAGVAEAAGYVALPESLVELAGIAVPLLAQMGDTQTLAAVVAGSASVGVIHPLSPLLNAAKVKDSFIVCGASGGQLQPRDALELSPRQSIDPLRELYKANVSGAANAVATHHGAVLSAAELLGLAQRMIDMAVDYAKDRQQFGQAIGAFQAVQHQLASAYTAIEFARPIVHLAAVKGGVAVHNAKLAAIDAATLAAETAIQVHGGMGYTYEVDLHLFMKRAWAVSAQWGDRNYHLKQLQNYLLEGEANTGPGHTFN